MTDTCKTCRYWADEHEEDGYFHDSRCHIRADPQPRRNAKDWCGEHKPFKAESLRPKLSLDKLIADHIEAG